MREIGGKGREEGEGRKEKKEGEGEWEGEKKRHALVVCYVYAVSIQSCDGSDRQPDRHSLLINLGPSKELQGDCMASACRRIDHHAGSRLAM